MRKRTKAWRAGLLSAAMVLTGLPALAGETETERTQTEGTQTEATQIEGTQIEETQIERTQWSSLGDESAQEVETALAGLGAQEADTETTEGATEAELDTETIEAATEIGTDTETIAYTTEAETETETIEAAPEYGTEEDSTEEEAETKTETLPLETEEEAALPEETVAETEAILTVADSAGDYLGTSVEEDALLTPGTYTITANLYVPGELNTVLPGMTAYLTNPNNPLGITEGLACEATVPTSPVYDNATLVVGEDGVTKILTLDVVNPVFTLRQIESGTNSTVLSTVWNSTVYSNLAGTSSRTGRITQITVQLNDNSGLYEFTNCKEFPTLLGTDWSVNLRLGVDLASVPIYTPQDTEDETTASTEAATSETTKTTTTDTTTQTQTSETATQTQTSETTTQTAETEASALSSQTDSTKTDTTTEEDAKEETEAASEKETETETDLQVALAKGTYRITANLYVPGELNTQLPGVTAYLTNPYNPLGIGGYEGVPTTPVSDNATLVVDAEGNMFLILEVVNPVFTLQSISDGENITVISTERDSEIYTGTTGAASKTGRITTLYLKLGDASGFYQFGDCTEFPTLLETDWYVSLQLSVDFSSAKRTSKKIKAEIPGVTFTDGVGEIDEAETESETESEETKSEDSKTGGETTQTETVETDASTRLSAGTYTVAANIWFEKADSGLPLCPHITSPEFPPKDPVSNNATLTVDEDGNATVTVPIVIQSKVMTVQSIRGLSILSSTRDASGNLTSITVDLGVITNPYAIITKSCTVSLKLGELAMTISGKESDQTWAATFQVCLSGIPTASGGGSVDLEELLAEVESETEEETEAVSVEVPEALAIFFGEFEKLMEDEVSVYTYELTVAWEDEEEEEASKAEEALEGDIFFLQATEETFEDAEEDVLIIGLLSLTCEEEETCWAVVTTEDVLEERPEALGEFLLLLQESLDFAEENPEEAAVYAFLYELTKTAAEAKEAFESLTWELFTGEDMDAACEIEAVSSLLYREELPLPEQEEEDETETETELSDLDALSLAIEEALLAKEEESAVELAAGTYQITANLYLPGELNTQLPGVTAYLTNPANPLGIGGVEGIPMEPVADNATLVVDEEGGMTLILEVANPVFTLQSIDGAEGLAILLAVRDEETYAGNTGVSREGRVTTLYLSLENTNGIYSFAECTEFPTLLEVDWEVPLELSVEFDTAVLVSGETVVEIEGSEEE